MPTLSSQYAYLITASGAKVYPEDVTVSLDESRAPYCQATVVVPRGAIPLTDLDPREGDRVRLHLQQDFGDLIYNSEVTADFHGDVSDITAGISPLQNDTFTRRYTKPWNVFETSLPLSTLTALYGGSVAAMTAAGLIDVWRITKLLHSSGSFNPMPSTVFHSDLGIRSIVEDYVAQTVTMELASDEALAQDRYGYGTDVPFFFTTLRSAIEFMLIYAGVYSGTTAKLDPAGGDFTLSATYTVENYFANIGKNLWEDMLALANSCGFALWCDQSRVWHLEPTTTVAGALTLADTDNITAFSRTLSREEKWYSNVNIEYATEVDQAFDPATPFGAKRYLYLDRKESSTIEVNGALSILQRTKSRGETYEVEAISNFDARPRQTITTNVTGIPLMSGVVQSVSWALPAARMSIKLRDLELV